MNQFDKDMNTIFSEIMISADCFTKNQIIGKNEENVITRMSLFTD